MNGSFADRGTGRGPPWSPAGRRVHAAVCSRLAVNRVSRYTEILKVLLRYGFSDLVRKMDADIYRRLRGGGRDSRRARKAWSRPEGMRRALEELGPTFVKIGQLMSHRPDLLPPEWILEFEKLRSRVPPADTADIRQVILEDLGGPPEEIFLSFDSTPIASASIAQVQPRRLPDGRAVAVKVQRPGITAGHRDRPGHTQGHRPSCSAPPPRTGGLQARGRRTGTGTGAAFRTGFPQRGRQPGHLPPEFLRRSHGGRA